MEFVEEEARPRFLLHSRTPAAAASPSAADPGSAAVGKPAAAAACVVVAAAAALLFYAFYFPLQSQTLTTLLVWAALSLLVGPFAPSSITGGDVRVGLGEPLELPEPDPSPEEEAEEHRNRNPGLRSKVRRTENPPPARSAPSAEKKSERRNGTAAHLGNRTEKGEAAAEVEESEWTDEDFEILKRQIAKHPVGTPQRWERIAEAFWGRHGVEGVIRTAKSLQERRPGAGDSFAQFLRQRKPLDKRAEGVHPELPASVPSENGEPRSGDVNGGGSGSGSWSSGEDIALLSALKAFPKDASMRWEKIAAVVPGKSKAACMRRVAELKRDFRNLKASEA